MKQILITGITGFVGEYLAEYLLSIEKDSAIHGTYHSESGLARIGDLKKRLTLHQVDLNDAAKVVSLIQSIKPQEIYHLAALSSVSDSFKRPAETLITNIASEVNLFEAVRSLNEPSVRILVVGSSEMYGNVQPSDLPLSEDTPLRPASPYAVSKITQDYLALQYYNSYKIQTLRARPFNHIGPRQSEKFVVPSFAKQIAEIEKGKRDPVIKVGNLTPKKDFTDVRDIVQAYHLLMQKGVPGEAYNIGSGKSVAIQELLAILLSCSNVSVKVEEDPSLVRPVEILEIRSDSSKLQNLTGWKPEITLEESLKNTLDYFRNLV